MGKHGKRYLDARASVEARPYAPEEGVETALELAKAKFDEAVELHIATSADPRHSDQQIREVAALPHGTGKEVRVFVFAEGDAARAAEAAGADYVVTDELISRIEGGWSDWDVSIATPDQMPKIGRLGRYLGRKGLMPNPRTGTVVQPDDIGRAIEETKQGRAEIRLDRGANIHARIGTSRFTSDQILANLASVYGTILRARPSGVKGQFVKSASICTTMGPSVKLDLPALEAISREG